jgi:hypothetical protein
MLNVLNLWVGLILLAILAVYVLDAGHYLYPHKRLDASITRFSTDAADSAAMVWQSYPVIQIVLATTMLWLSVYWFHNRYLLAFLKQPDKQRKWYAKSVHLLLAGAISLMAHKPL